MLQNDISELQSNPNYSIDATAMRAGGMAGAATGAAAGNITGKLIK